MCTAYNLFHLHIFHLSKFKHQNTVKFNPFKTVYGESKEADNYSNGLHFVGYEFCMF
jgi:hypothetical protein